MTGFVPTRDQTPRGAESVSFPAPGLCSLQRLEEREESFLVADRQCSEGIGRALGLATMARYGLAHRLSREVV